MDSKSVRLTKKQGDLQNLNMRMFVTQPFKNKDKLLLVDQERNMYTEKLENHKKTEQD